MRKLCVVVMVGAVAAGCNKRVQTKEATAYFAHVTETPTSVEIGVDDVPELWGSTLR